MPQTRDQRMAESVYRLVLPLKDQEAQRKKYGSLAHKLPVLIKTAGLAQALAFVESRGGDEGKLLLRHIAEVVQLTNLETLQSTVRKAELRKYIRLTQEILTALVWFKRFAQSVLKVEPGEENTNA
ncbi:MAG TPA: type III-B CRISPR module-associated protein Cmr5 [Acidobacteriota bacterium]|nr:type III-B CRISPR module-associated protein Cmr5 [Acidobacteriota bacterium]